LHYSLRPRRIFTCAVAVVGVSAYVVLTSIGSQSCELAPLFSLTPPSMPCLAMPLPPIQDPVALAFENGFGGGSRGVDRNDMVPGASRALQRFERVVTSAGGTITVTSAYRPAAYQQHLQQVWDKWMRELRNNAESACQPLRMQVRQEFRHHGLIESQRPATTSDHTRGLAFDASIELPPPPAKLRRKAPTLDKLARLCGLRRPDIGHDPVHFKFLGAVRGRGRSA
jgi:hypothetical protein